MSDEYLREPEFTEFECNLAAAVQCIYVVNRWRAGCISTEEARTELRDWDHPDRRDEPGRLELWAGETTL